MVQFSLFLYVLLTNFKHTNNLMAENTYNLGGKLIIVICEKRYKYGAAIGIFHSTYFKLSTKQPHINFIINIKILMKF